MACKTKCKQDNYNSMVNKQRWTRRNQKRRKPKQRMALRFPRPYILVHNRNRIENAPYDFVILLYLTTLNNILLNETLHSRLNINCAGENVITTTKNGGHYERRAAVGRRNTPLNSNVAVSSAQKTSACLRK